MSINKDGLRLYGRVCLIIGGSRGIGADCVRLFAEHGANVTFSSNQKEEGEALEADIVSSGAAQVEFVLSDCTIEDEVKMVVERCVKRWGKIDCLINNVGWHPPRRSIDDFTTNDLRQLLEINVISHFSFCKYALPELRKTKGNIIFISSMVTVYGQPKAITYVTTKGAIDGMMKALAVDEAAYGVRVNTVLPSNVDTPLMREFSKNSELGEDAALKLAAKQALLGRLSSGREVAQACLFLASEATFCTGNMLAVSGGTELNYGIQSRLLEHQ